MKRFWREAIATEDGRILLDGRPVWTPKGAPLALPTGALAEAVSAEWNAVGEKLDPRQMPLTGLANAAIDVVAPDVPAFAAGLAAWAAHDLTCYRATHPAELVGRQVAAWEPVLKAVERRHGLVFRRTAGVTPVAQPAATLDRLARGLSTCSPFVLAGLSPLATIAGSIVLALGVVDGDLDAGAAFAASSVDEDFQAERWGADAEAARVRTARAAEFAAAARFLALAGA